MNYVLIINRDPNQREEIASALEGLGIPCKDVESEYDAVTSLQGELPSIIVWDWPAQDIPPEIFIAVLRQEGFCGTLLVCTAALDVDDIPFDLMLQKPFRMDLLTSTVERLSMEEAKHIRRRRFCELRGA